MTGTDWLLLLAAWAACVLTVYAMAKGVDAWMDRDTSDEQRAWERFRSGDWRELDR